MSMSNGAEMSAPFTDSDGGGRDRLWNGDCCERPPPMNCLRRSSRPDPPIPPGMPPMPPKACFICCSSSYCLRLSGVSSCSQAPCTALNRSSAAVSSGFRSGWYWRANLRKARLISACGASFETPSVRYGSVIGLP